ncbi:MAG: hypothetical protein NTZ67_09140 [Gammaproteobacteria bacterium]|nr:hypothetical protein [Gammaproteobacteria bacterium]
MKKLIIASIILFFTSTLLAGTDNIEKIIFIRHGEKPLMEIGQLNCQGLNRSLMLPGYFKANFPNPDYIFAPNPAVQIENYSYIRPLATIEPTAISLDMPVNAEIGFNQPQLLLQTLLKNKYHSALVYVAWEHWNIQQFAQLILTQFNNPAVVPVWPENEFNRVYVFTINWGLSPATVDFKISTEGFKDISTVCPS